MSVRASRVRRGRWPQLWAAALCAGLLPGVAFTPPAHAAASLPGGFNLVTQPSGQAAFDLTDFTVLGDGSRYTTGKSGKVAWVSADRKTIRTVAQLPAFARQDVGLVGIWPANNYDQTGHVYVVYPRPNGTGSNFNRVSRLTANNPANPTSLGSETVIIDGIRQNVTVHGAGTVLQAPDGTLYAGFGDEASAGFPDPTALRSQDINDPHGKILRFDATGSGVPSNPFYDPANPTSWKSRVFAFGLRNPTRFSLDPRSGAVYLGDVGWNSWEEFEVSRGGENFGWPCYEGNIQTPGYRDLQGCKNVYAANARHDPPLYTYPHSGAGASVIGGLHYTGTEYPEQYRGKYFLADYVQQIIRFLGTDINHRITTPPATFGTGLGAPVAIRAEPNGDISYADIISGTIKRLRYAAGNRAPNAVASVTNNPDNLQVTIDASASSDLDNDVLTFSTDFGDGSPKATGVKVTHQYAQPGTYTAVVTVTDPLGATDTVTLTVKPQNHTPVLQATMPPANQKFAVGSTVTINATATDAEDGNLLPRFSVVLQHCPATGSCHAHPDRTVDGNTFSEEFTNHGGDTSMQITVSVTDQDGAVVSQQYEAFPDVHQVNVSSPVPITINGFTATSLPLVTGEPVTVAAPALFNGRQIQSWSDGGAATHTFPMPANDVVLTARYLSEIATKYAQINGPVVLGSPTSAETAFTTAALAGGRYRLYQQGAILWSSITGAHYIKGALYARYWAGSNPSFYGFPTSDVTAVPGGAASYFQRGRAYWSPASGAHFVRSWIQVKYLQLGGPTWGFPMTDETRTPDGRGYYNHFTGTKSIYWTLSTGGHNVQGPIRTKWASLGWERGCLGYPTSDQFVVSNGLRNNFQRGWIRYNPWTGGFGWACY